MKKNKICIIIIFVLLFFHCSFAVSSKNKGLTLEKIIVEKKLGNTQSVLSAGSSQSIRSRDKWARIRVIFDVRKKQYDSLKFEFQVFMMNPEAKKKSERFTILKGNVEHQFVFFGRDKRTEMFIHPSVIKKFGEVLSVRINVRSPERDLDKQSYYVSSKVKKSYAEWWKRNDVEVKSDLIFNRFRTPFIHDGDNSKELIKIN